MNKMNLMMMVTVVMCGGMLTASAAENVQKPEKVEVRHSMLGYRNTLLFYTFKEQRVVMVLKIDNKDETFPVTGKAHLFDKATTEEAIKKWINNQHSDGLFVDAAIPQASKNLPAGFCKVTSKKQTGTSNNPGPGGGTFKDFEVGLSIKAQAIDESIKLPTFTDTARVHVQSK